MPTTNTYLKGLTLPFTVKQGAIFDGAGKEVINANRQTNGSPISAAGSDALIKLTCELLNKSFEYDEADRILKRLGY